MTEPLMSGDRETVHLFSVALPDDDLWDFITPDPDTGAYPLRFDGNGPIANIITGMQIQGMPIDYPATRNDKVNAVTLEQVNDVARRYLKPDDLRFVVVGQPDGLSSTN